MISFKDFIVEGSKKGFISKRDLEEVIVEFYKSKRIRYGKDDQIVRGLVQFFSLMSNQEADTREFDVNRVDDCARSIVGYPRDNGRQEYSADGDHLKLLCPLTFTSFWKKIYSAAGLSFKVEE